MGISISEVIGGGDKTSSGMASLTRVIDPKDLDPQLKSEVIATAKQIFSALDCSGVCRMDFMFDTAKNQLYFNEINPIPGSLSFYLWEKMDPPILYTELIERMLQRALERHAEKLSLRHSFGFHAL